VAQNYVEIKVKASDDGARVDLDALRFDLEAIGSKIETARVDVDDKDAAAKLLRLNAQLAELNRKVENPRLSTAGAAKVEAQIAAIDAALDHLNDKHADPKVTLDGAAEVLAEVELLNHELDKLNDKGDTAGGSLSRLSTILAGIKVPDFVPLFGGGGPAALAALTAGLAGLLPEIVAVASGFAAAGAGAGAFALLARPAVSQVTAAYQGLNAAQQKYQNALALEKLDPTKAHAAAVKAALDQLNLAGAAIGKLPADEQKAVDGLYQLRQEFGKLSNAFRPQVFKVFADGLRVVNNLLPHLTQFATPFANALDGLLSRLGQFTKSAGFNQWLSQLAGLVGPATNAIGQGIGKVAVAFGKLLTMFSGKDVAHAINIAFGGVAGVLDGVRLAIHALMQEWDKLSTSSPTLKRIVQDFKTAWDQLTQVGKGKKPDFSVITSALQDAVTTAAGWASKQAGHLLKTGLQNAASWLSTNAGNILFSVGGALIDGLINGIKSKWPALGSIISQTVGMLKTIGSLLGIHSPSRVFHEYGVAIMDGLMGGMASRTPDLRSQMAGISGMISGGIGPGGYGGRGGGQLQLQVMPGGGSAFEQFMVSSIRQWVRVKGGGSVQSAFGRS
jgi:hypothetical protein